MLSDLPPPDDKPMPSALELDRADRASFVLGPIGLGYDRATDRLLIQLEEVGELDEDGEIIDDTDRGHVRLYVTAARRPRSASTPTTWSPPAGRRAGGAATPSTPTVTRARG